jgi:EpsI family protein
MTRPLLARAVAICVLLAATTIFLANARRAEVTVARSEFKAFPMTAGAWSATADSPLDDEVLKVLGVDDYLSRVYYQPDGAAVGLYAGYYVSQRQGDTIHSPQNCLPGAGWEPVAEGRLSIANADGHGRDIIVNRYIVQKGLERQLVLYWYQSHGRVVASEYWSKIYLITDAIRANRTDGSMVRVISPIAAGDESGASAERVAEDFVRAIFPALSAYLPE